jgi:oligoribonuclease
MSGDDRIVWIDLETTGLDPDADSILEVGCIITDGQLDEIARWSSVLELDGRGFERIKANRLVREMHTGSGLLNAAIADEATCLGWTALALRAFIQTYTTDAPLAGSTIGFDRSFLRVHMPEALAICHYRSIDVSSLKLLAKLWGFAPAEKSRPAMHRALPDLEDSIAELRHYRATMLRAPIAVAL